MSEPRKRSYQRQEIAAYIAKLDPERRRNWIDYMIHRVRAYVAQKFKNKATDYVQSAIGALCNAEAAPMLLNEDLNITGLIIRISQHFYIKDAANTEREREILQYRAFILSQDADPENRFPEKRWALFKKILSTLDERDQQLVKAALEGECFRIGPNGVQIDNKKLATRLDMSPREVARSMERVRGRMRGQFELQEEEDE